MPVNPRVILLCVLLATCYLTSFAQRQMEKLNRGLVVVSKSPTSNYISWRIFADDAKDIAFELYRKSTTQQEVKISSKKITQSSDFTDQDVDPNELYTYRLTQLINGQDSTVGHYQLVNKQPYIAIPLQIPPAKEIDGKIYTYNANDASVGGLDGDGQYEIILKWDPSNSKNPPQLGFTGNQLLDAYTLEGKLLWRIDLGKNIRSGAAYTQFLVYDFDGDGRSEIICKTADGTIDGTGKVIGDPDKD